MSKSLPVAVVAYLFCVTTMGTTRATVMTIIPVSKAAPVRTLALFDLNKYSNMELCIWFCTVAND